METVHNKGGASAEAVWNAIYRIVKSGNEAAVKLRNGEIQVVEIKRSVKLKLKMDGG